MAASTATAKKVNYSESDVARLHEMYETLGNEGLEQIAQELGKSVRSVRAKLVRDQVYVAPEKGAKIAKKDGPSKKEMMLELAAVSPFPTEGFMGATKEAIQSLIDHLRETKTH